MLLLTNQFHFTLNFNLKEKQKEQRSLSFALYNYNIIVKLDTRNIARMMRINLHIAAKLCEIGT